MSAVFLFMVITWSFGTHLKKWVISCVLIVDSGPYDFWEVPTLRVFLTYMNIFKNDSLRDFFREMWKILLEFILAS